MKSEGCFRVTIFMTRLKNSTLLSSFSRCWIFYQDHLISSSGGEPWTSLQNPFLTFSSPPSETCVVKMYMVDSYIP